jgi:hypothetical protein
VAATPTGAGEDGVDPRVCIRPAFLADAAFRGQRRHGRPTSFPPGSVRMEKDTWRVVTRGRDGELVIHDFDSAEALLRTHLQVGVDDCSTDLALRGAPVFRSLVGPMPEGRNIIRYETPEVFESLTKEWAMPRSPRRRSRKAAAAPQTEDSHG